MNDAVEWILGALSVVLGGVAFAVGGHVIREAWREAFKSAPPGPSRPAAAWFRPGTTIPTAPAEPGPPDREQGNRD